MSFNPLNSPGVRVILLDKTVKDTPVSGGTVPEPFRTPFAAGAPPLPIDAEWEVDPQLLAEWEVDEPVEPEAAFDPLFIILPFDSGGGQGT